MHHKSGLGISADQISAFVDALLEKQEHGTARIAPTEVQATHTQWMLGPWAEELAGPWIRSSNRVASAG